MDVQWTLLLDSAGKLGLAAILGGLIGFERESKQRPAGIRTHMLVSMSATLICIVSMNFAPGSHPADPARIAAQIVTGIGFLGAGTIMRQGSIVVGLTTAASLWTVAAIGMAVSVGGVFYLIALTATILTWTTLLVIRRIEKSMGHERGNRLRLEASTQMDGVDDLLAFLGHQKVAVETMGVSEAGDPNTVTVRIEAEVPREVPPGDIARALVSDPRIRKVEWVSTRYRGTSRILRAVGGAAHDDEA
jgi:putative Mg2+ transporter-C (MgtC) family protein